MTLIPTLTDGFLPRGRFPMSMSEVQTHFVPQHDQTRVDIWDEWARLTEILRSVVGRVPAAWLSGSFFSDKPVPSDIDCVYLVNSSDWCSVSNEQHRAFLEVVERSGAKSRLNIRVDSYVLQWRAWPGVQPAPEDAEYLQYRGYWDDFWSRRKDDDAAVAALPRRGYLEVIIDGYE